jgi:ribosomal-protein-serine acetyltransferase
MEPPARIAAPVELRRLVEADAPALHAAVRASVDHLRPWMIWIGDEPAGLDDRRALLRTWAEQWAAGTDQHYGLWAPGGGDAHELLVGVLGVHDRRGPATRELGYWVHVDAVGRGIATAAAYAATRTLLALPDVEAVEICHDVANVLSGRIPARLGFTHVADETRAPEAPAETGIHRVWRCEDSAALRAPRAVEG